MNQLANCQKKCDTLRKEIKHQRRANIKQTAKLAKMVYYLNALTDMNLNFEEIEQRSQAWWEKRIEKEKELKSHE